VLRSSPVASSISKWISLDISPPFLRWRDKASPPQKRRTILVVAPWRTGGRSEPFRRAAVLAITPRL
jgi:hypothetical protein